MPIRTGDHEPLGRCDRRRCPAAFDHEARKRMQEHANRERGQDHADTGDESRRVRRAPSRQQPRHEPGDDARRGHEKHRAAGSRFESAHPSSVRRDAREVGEPPAVTRAAASLPAGLASVLPRSTALTDSPSSRLIAPRSGADRALRYKPALMEISVAVAARPNVLPEDELRTTVLTDRLGLASCGSARGGSGTPSRWRPRSGWPRSRSR